jgi:hypothetical protein
VLAEQALEAVIASITAHAFAVTSGRFFLIRLGLFHFKTYLESGAHRAKVEPIITAMSTKHSIEVVACESLRFV